MKSKATAKRMMAALLTLAMVFTTWLGEVPVKADVVLPSATNTTFDSARNVIFGSSMSESTTGSDKFRYYKLTVKQAGNLMLHGHGDEHFKITLYDADHTKIWSDGIWYNDDYSYSVCITGGTYYVEAEADASYRMTIAYNSLSESFKETQDKNNDMIGTASKIALKKKYKGVLTINDGIDYYKFSVPAKGKINFSTTNATSAYVKYLFYDKNLNEVYNVLLRSGYKASEMFDITSGTYYLAVVQNTPGSGTGSYNFSIDYSVKTPAKVNGIKVKNASGKKLNVQWKKVSGASGYELQYATKSNFKSGVSKKDISSKKTSVTYTKLKKGKTYYVRMRAYVKVNGKKVYGSWSSKKSIKIKK